jgi:hypothetical protein
MKKHIYFILLIGLAVTLLAHTSVYAANTLKFSESYTQKNHCFTIWSARFCDPLADKGKFTVKSKIYGIDRSMFTGDTPFSIMIGAFYFEGTLGDDRFYKAGGNKFKVTYVARNEDTGRLIQYVKMQLKWNKKNDMTLTLTGTTPDFADSPIALQYLWESTHGIGDQDIAYFALGDNVYAGFYVNYTGSVKTRNKVKKGKENGTSIVKIKGTGSETSDDFRTAIPN